MTQYAFLAPSTTITLLPGDVQTYLLPTMMPGEFHLYSNQVGLGGLSPGQLGSGGTPMPAPVLRPANEGPAQPGGIAVGSPLAPNGNGGGTSVQAVDLLMDLFHGDQLVVSGKNNLPPQLTSAEGDDTWRVRLQLPAGTVPGNYSYFVTLNPYPSNFPILTRRIPLAFFKQGFDDNWNGRNYISLEVSGVDTLAFTLSIDPEVASYYGLPLSSTSFPLGQLYGLTLPNITTSFTQLSIGSTDSGYGPLAGPLVYVEFTVGFTGGNGQQPMQGSYLGKSFSLNNFNVVFRLFLTVGPGTYSDTDSVDLTIARTVGYLSQIETDLLSKVNVNFSAPDPSFTPIQQLGSIFLTDVVNHILPGKLDSAISSWQSSLDSMALAVGPAITPWLLGAAFGVLNVRYDPANSQPVPKDGPQGDLVIDYIGQLTPATTGPVSSTLGVSADSPLTLNATLPPSGLIGELYSQTFTASGGVPPYTWTMGGTLPPGTTANGSTLSGTSSLAGTYSVVVTVKDAANTEVSATYTIAINPSGLSIITNPILPDAVITQPYAVELAVQGAPGSHLLWNVNDLPSGLTLLSQGVITGSPTGSAGSETFVLQVNDSHGLTAWQVFSINLQDPPLFTEPFYAPRGDGNTIWKPNPPTFTVPTGTVVKEPATTPGNLSKIDHIVLVMMENRSFDHMLGYLSREGGRSDIEGLKWETGSNRTQYNFYKGRYYYPNLLTDTGIITTEALSPDHSHENVKGQMADGMMHFVTDYAKSKAGNWPDQLKIVIGYYGAAQLPVYDMLAREFAVCDHWFASHVGPTWPNRFVAMTGDLNRDSYGEPEVDTPSYTDFTPSEALTLFDHLTARGVSWRYFQQRESMMRAFTKYSFDMVNVLEYSDPVNGFKATVASGALPSFTWIDPLFGDLPAGINSPQDNDDAPPSDLKYGQAFIAEIVHTLFARTNRLRDKTMLIIVYDEHGGFYDHVDPPANATPLLGQNSGKLGPRVPAFVISPFTPAALVIKDTCDHSTIAATVLRRFCSPNPPFMSARVTAALDLRDALPLAVPRGGIPETVEVVPAGATSGVATRTAIRRFKAPTTPDAYGPFLGGIALTLGSKPR
jgi:phospholipase C